MEHFADSYQIAEDAQQTAAALVSADFPHLLDARVVVLRSANTVFHRGQRARACVFAPGHTAAAQEERRLVRWLLAQFTALPDAEDADFLIVLDGPLWDVSSTEEREWLVFHELCHIEQRTDDDTGAPKFDKDGRPMLRLVAHDAEFFHREAERYGSVIPGIEDAAIAIANGLRAHPRRRLRAV